MDESLDTAPCCYLAFTDDSILRTVNTTLRTLLGYGPGELEDRPITAILSVGGRVFYQTHLFPSLKMHGKVEEIYLSLRTRDGKEIPVLLNGVRRGDRSECVLVTMHQRSRFEDEILRAKKSAEEANRAKEAAYEALAAAHQKLENANVELEAQQDELQAQQRRLLELYARENRIADVLQNALRPVVSGHIDGISVATHYQPALDEAEIGGDFYDVFSLKRGVCALVVADVSGKGLTAAAQVATVRQMLRALLYQQNRTGLTMAESVTSLNDMLVDHALLEGFTTLFVGAYDAEERTLTYVNAGQEPGLLLRKATHQVEELGPTGPVLGGFRGAAFTESVTPFVSGDALALFTDGLTEAGANRKDLLEVTGVATLFQRAVAAAKGPSPGEIASRIMAGVTAAVTPAGIRDDVCLLVARGTG